MSTYRRATVPGAIYFFTVALADRRSRVLVEHADALRAAFVATAREHPVRVDAMVVLPDHLHAVWRLPDGDADFPVRWRKLKARFTRAIGGEWRSSGRVGDSPTRIGGRGARARSARASAGSGSGATGST
jgi:putative transposase